jgi:type IV pilus assembly protein PilO
MAAAAPQNASALSKLPLPARIGATVGFMALVGAAYWMMFYDELATKVTREQGQHAQLRTQLTQQQQAQARYFADRDELTLRQQRQRDLNKVLPAETEAASFLSSLQQVSNLSGIDLKAWQPEEEKVEPYYARVPMKLEFSGKFHQLARFTYEVGRLDRIINLENIELSDAKWTGEDLVLKAKFRATTFHALTAQQQPQAQAARAGATPPGGKK